MPDIIQLKDLKVLAQIGHLVWEQRIKQPIFFDVEVTTDIRMAAQSQKLTDTIDYGALATLIENYVEENAFRLLETLAEEVASLILREFKVEKIKLTVRKPFVLSNLREAAITIERP